MLGDPPITVDVKKCRNPDVKFVVAIRKFRKRARDRPRRVVDARRSLIDCGAPQMFSNRVLPTYEN
jgi:hypothetical protein